MNHFAHTILVYTHKMIHHCRVTIFLHTCLVIALHLQAFCNAGSLSHEAKEVFLAALVSEGHSITINTTFSYCCSLW
jgi:hypothetical protein